MSPLRQTLVVARRDFMATVATPVFLLFLLAPLLMGAVSTLAGLGAARVVDGPGPGAGGARLVAVLAPAERAAVAAADARLRPVFRDGEGPPRLETPAPAPGTAGDLAATAHAAFARGGPAPAALLYGPLAGPVILEGPRGSRAADYLAELARQAVADRRLGASAPRLAVQRIRVGAAGRPAAARRPQGFFAVFAMFFLTLFLASQAVGTMAEERNNKVIEILAAAAPLETVFLGKLLGLFGVALLFVGFWAGVAGLLAPNLAGVAGGFAPAVGPVPFGLLFVLYFTMAYLLLGAVFLGLGAQASSPREIQMLSLPITATQVAMFALASAAAAHPGTTLARVAELFPLSSPFAMVARSADQPGLWRHAAALGWQALWVVVFIAAGARLFRRGVLRSGSPGRWWRRARPVGAAAS